jgi:hypothetical protein
MKVGKVVLAMALTVAIVIAVSGAASAQATYVSNKQCKVCHNTKEMGEIWNAWKATPHAKAFETLSTPAALEAGKKAGVDKPAESPKCLVCHLTAADAATAKQPETLVKEDGVQCETCHGAASLHKADGMKFKSGDKTIKMDAHITVKPDEKLCVTCHNDKSPTWKGKFDFKASWEKVKHGIPKKG